LTATYKFDTSDQLIDVVQKHEGYIYSRWDNPSVIEVETAMAELEGYDRSLAFSSGMAAITTTLLAIAKPGCKIVATRELYGATFEFLNDILPQYSIETEFMHCWETDRILETIDEDTSIVYLESPTNPLIRIVDIEPLAMCAHRHGAVVMLDSTFASPINQKPAELGVDITFHSATKYLGGHHDITAGMTCCKDEHWENIWSYRKILGGVMDPMTAFLLLRGMQTLELRIRRQNESAMRVAEYLQTHKKVRAVHYPGLTSHPDHDIALRQMSGFGGILSFEVDADFEETKRFMDSLSVIKLATSLGGVTSLANQPITNTHVALSPANRKRAGISESLVRFSVGVEDVELLIGDLEQALRSIAG
jgi:cystathionine gamma-synthase